MDPAFWLDAFPLDDTTRFFTYLTKNMIVIKRLGVATYFCFIFKGVNKIRKKTLSVTPHLENVVCEKPNLDSRVGLLIGKVR